MIKLKKTLIFAQVIGLLFVSISINAQELYVATNGNDNASGNSSNPLATLSAAVKKSVDTGAKTIWIKGGTYSFDERIDLTEQHSGLKISGYQDEKVIFEGGTNISSSSFTVINDNISGRIQSSVVGKLYAATIVDSEIINLLKDPKASISFNDLAINIARFPNEGFAVFRKEQVINGNETVNTAGTYASPKGPVFKLRSHDFNNDAWENEIIRHKKLLMSGYTSAVWLSESALIATAKSNGDYLRQVDGTKYGIEDREVNRLKKVYFTNILYELDAPGEWFFDEIDNKLYIYPTTVITPNSKITLWTGTEFIYIDNASDITLERFQVQNVGKSTTGGDGVINVRNECSNINVAGIIFKNIANMASLNFWQETSNSTIKSCDFIDAEGVRFYGGSYNHTSVVAGNNVMENCHYTVVHRKDFYGKACGMNGVGNTFRNNLIHNTNGQPFTFYGLDHVVEKNEVFNTGVEEGDGGSMYGGNGLFTFNNTFKHNFYHHMMSFPGDYVGRAGIHFDDFDAGDYTYENIFYRGGRSGVKMGSGGQHKVNRNIIIGSDNGIKNGNRLVDDPIYSDVYNKCMNYLTTDPTSSNKENYIGRALKAVGVDGWQNGLTADNWTSKIDPFWANRYPRFSQLMNDYFTNKKMLPYGCDFSDNYFAENKQHFDSPTNIPLVANPTEISLGIFTDINTLNFSYNGTQPNSYPDIKFNEIGLYADAYRCAIPNKDVYRKAVKEFFKDRVVHGEDYDDATVNQLTYFNSGKVAYKTVPCIGVVEETGDDSYTITAISETCPGKSNGQIKIEAKTSGTYKANLNGGSDITFTGDWLIEDLVPGDFDLCITNTDTNQEQCFSLVIEAGAEVTGKTSSKNGKVTIAITKGTAPYDVLVNGKRIMQTHSSSFEVSAQEGDLVEVKTSVICEGALSQLVSGLFNVSPNPTQGRFRISISMPMKEVPVSVYNVYGQQVLSKVYPVVGGQVELDINDQPVGIYFTKMDLKSSTKTLKIIKK